MKANNEIIKETNNLMKEFFKKLSITDNLIRIKKEVATFDKYDSKRDVRIYQERMEGYLEKINSDIDKLTSIYNGIYANSLGIDAFDIVTYRKLQIRREKGLYTIYYYDRLPKNSKREYKQTTNFFMAFAYAIQEYIDKQDIYPKPMYKNVKILIETIYDVNSKEYVWDNDHLSRFHITEIINALQFVGLIRNDSGFNTSFEICSKSKRMSDTVKKKYYKSKKKKDCLAYTKITIIPQ